MQRNFISHQCAPHHPLLPVNAFPHATLQPVDFHLLTHNPYTPTYLHTYMEKKMKNGMLRMKSRDTDGEGEVARAEVDEEKKEDEETKESVRGS